jgi:L-ribulose-5-phosphate 3-epimerase
MKIAMVTANYVARESQYRMDPFDWMKAHYATEKAFTGPQYPAKFREIMGLVKATGYANVEIWTPHLPERSDDATIAVAKEILADLGLTPIGYYYGVFGIPHFPRAEAVQGYRVARALGVPFFVGTLHPSNREMVAELCREYGVKMAIENHAETDPAQIIAYIGPHDDVLGTAVDTGWWGTQGVDAVAAVRALQGQILHVHLKDIREAGAHRTCAFGEGVVNVRGVVEELKRQGYDGYISVEHEPEAFDPTDDLKKCLADLKGWLAG